MTSLKQKVYDWKDRLKDRHMLTIVIVLITIIVALSLYTYKKQRDYRQASENSYNLAFYELVDYVNSVEVYLAKSLVGAYHLLSQSLLIPTLSPTGLTFCPMFSPPSLSYCLLHKHKYDLFYDNF